ncbi:hypothetical protein LCGC14_1205910 [marine sediment metagenome]|uniref:Uncharacterized protein n=1 Tax=marine sediment metagenome TaxID=412755 RepID=A0A0F9PK71_9ZZZZ
MSSDAKKAEKVVRVASPAQRAVRNVRIANDAVFNNMSHGQLAEKYGMTLAGMKKVRARPEIKELEERWTSSMFAVQRDMGAAALASTMKLIMEGDPGTIKDYWKRMGVSKEPTIEIEVQELKFQVPDAMKPIMETLAKEIKQLKGDEEEDVGTNTD